MSLHCRHEELSGPSQYLSALLSRSHGQGLPLLLYNCCRRQDLRKPLRTRGIISEET